MNGAVSDTVPIEFVATTCTWYAPVNASFPSAERPSHGSCCAPGWSFEETSVAMTMPVRVSIVAVTVAG